MRYFKRLKSKNNFKNADVCCINQYMFKISWEGSVEASIPHLLSVNTHLRPRINLPRINPQTSDGFPTTPTQIKVDDPPSWIIIQTSTILCPPTHIVGNISFHSISHLKDLKIYTEVNEDQQKLASHNLIAVNVPDQINLQTSIDHHPTDTN